MSIKNRLFFFLLLAASALLSGCGHLIHLDRAQNNFTRGAELENRLRFDPPSDVSASPYGYYTLAHAEVQKALRNDKKLSADNVLANAYSIKALCEWKLGQYEAAEKSAANAREEMRKMRGKISLQRDEVLMEALPALIVIDSAKDTLYALHTTIPSFEAGKKHYLEFIYNPDDTEMAGLETAIEKIGGIRESAPISKSLSAYFTMSQLAALKTWSDALDDLSTCIREDPGLDKNENRAAYENALDWLDKQGKDLTDWKEGLLKELRSFVPGERGERLAEYWNFLIGG